MDSLVDRKQCKPQYQDIITCLKSKAQENTLPNQRISYFSLCQEQFEKLGNCVTKQ